MCARKPGAVMVSMTMVVALASFDGCGGSSSRQDGGPGINSSRVSRGGSLPDAFTPHAGAPGAAGGSGGGGTSGGAGGASVGGAGGQAGTVFGGASGAGSGMDGSPPDFDAAGEAPSPDPGPGACEQGGVCERLNVEYGAALTRARACMPAGSAQCTQIAPELLECPDCQTWVTTTDETAALQAQARAAGCDRCVPRCPARPCREPKRGACQATGGILFPTGHACNEAGLLP